MKAGQWIALAVLVLVVGGAMYLMFRTNVKPEGDGGPGDGPSVGTPGDTD